MKAVLLHEYGDASQLKYEDTEVPPYGDNEVLVKIRATSINPIDWKVRSGAAKARFPVEFPAILGRDLAGEVEACGKSVSGFPKGMRVMALANGTYAEYTTAKADTLAPIPDALTFEQAAALPLVTLTGTQLIERAVKPAPGWTVLVTGALGSVGRTAVHVAGKHGARVLAGVRATECERALHDLKVESAVAIDDEHEIAKLVDLDAIADTVNGPTIRRLLKAIRAGGVLGSVLGAPETASGLDLRVSAIMAVPDASRLYQLAEDVARSEFTIPIARVMKLSEIQEAHRLAEHGGTGGKIILVP
ncbi:MAG TPA: NADP-dependent oxidoreductase [Terracidiphilus sp.]|jgi:NADPH:quinone reductase-like Zn-dependent oxidoreductase|nr:NADP-dependent oxidoreductase [Terracidiphilus sp.]